jgi:hypothetical protein
MNVVTSTGKAAHPARSPRSARGTRPGIDTPAVPPAGLAAAEATAPLAAVTSVIPS